MRPPTVNKARPGHERETEIKLCYHSQTIVRTYSHTHTGEEDRAWKAPEPTLAAQDVCSVQLCTCVWHVRCPDSELVVMTEHEPSPRAFVSRSLFSSFVCFRPSTPCLVGQSKAHQDNFFHNILSEAVTFLFLCSASQSKLLSVLDMLSKS